MSTLTQLIGGGGNSIGGIACPAPVTTNWNGQAIQNVIPTGANDGSSIALPINATGNLIYNNASNTAIWTKAPSAVNASANTWGNFYVDTVESVVYATAWASGTLGTMYMAKFALSTGNATALGSNTSQTSYTATDGSYGFMERAANGSGDITLMGVASGTTPHIESISSSAGTITVADAAIVQDSFTLAEAKPFYVTADGTLVLGVTSSGNGYINIWRGGRQARISFSVLPEVSNPFAPSLDGARVIIVGTWAVIAQPSSNGPVYGNRVFNRTDFDTFLQSLASAMGL